MTVDFKTKKSVKMNENMQVCVYLLLFLQKYRTLNAGINKIVLDVI